MSVELGNTQGPLEEWAQKAEVKYPAWAAKIRAYGQSLAQEAQLFREAGGPESWEAPATVEQLPEGVVTPSHELIVLTAPQLVEQLHEELKRDRKMDIALPQPRPEFLEMQKIFAGEGFNMVPVVYKVGRKEISYALLDASVRPPYDKGLQMYKEDIREDGQNGPLAAILVRGRESGRIAIPPFVSHVPHNSRFAVSWDEIDGYVAPEVAKVSPHLTKQIEVSRTELRVQNDDEFKQAGALERFAHLGQSDTWVWLYNNAGLGYRLLGGYSGYGGVSAVDSWRSGHRYGFIAFGLQAVMPPQKIG